MNASMHVRWVYSEDHEDKPERLTGRWSGSAPNDGWDRPPAGRPVVTLICRAPRPTLCLGTLATLLHRRCGATSDRISVCFIIYAKYLYINLVRIFRMEGLTRMQKAELVAKARAPTFRSEYSGSRPNLKAKVERTRTRSVPLTDFNWLVCQEALIHRAPKRLKPGLFVSGVYIPWSGVRRSTN